MDDYNDFQKALTFCLEKGFGRDDGKKWTHGKFADACGIKLATFSSWTRLSKPYHPDPDAFELIYKTFFPYARDHTSGSATELRRTYNEVTLTKKRRQTELSVVELEKFSQIHVWDSVMKTKSGEFESVVVGNSKAKDLKFGGFAPDELQLIDTGKRFFLKVPDVLRSKVLAGDIDYEIHEPDGLEFPDRSLAQVQDDLHGFDLIGCVSKYAELYANRVVSAFQSETAKHKPYNKPKFGVTSITSHIPSTADETTACEIRLYETDYFTNWVFSQVFKELRQQRPGLVSDLDNYPTLSVAQRDVFFPQLAPSLGLNCFIVSKPPVGQPHLCFTRLHNASSNAIQHNRLHVPVNEGLNTEDRTQNGKNVSVQSW